MLQLQKIACLLLVVSIAFAGCYDVEIDKITGKPISDNGTDKEREITQAPYSRDWWGDWESFSELTQRIESIERADKLLLVRIADLEAELESQKAEEKADKALLVRIADLEATIESQRAEIESSTNAYCLYEVAIEAQRVTIESLEKLCRMYEAEIESQGKSRSSEESPLGKEPEAGQHQVQE